MERQSLMVLDEREKSYAMSIVGNGVTRSMALIIVALAVNGEMTHRGLAAAVGVQTSLIYCDLKKLYKLGAVSTRLINDGVSTSRAASLTGDPVEVVASIVARSMDKDKRVYRDARRALKKYVTV